MSSDHPSRAYIGQLSSLQDKATVQSNPSLIKKPKNHLSPIFSPDFTLNSQIWLFYDEKWIFVKLLAGMRTTAKLIQTPHFCPWEKKARTQFSLNSTPLIWTLSSHSNLFSRTLPVATFWTYKRKTVCFLHSLHCDPKDFQIKQGLAGYVMQL